MRKERIVIIGGGVIGCSIAFFLMKKGCKRVTLMEKEPILGSGSTGKSAGGIRQQFSTDINIKMSMRSVEIFENFKEIVGAELDFQQEGYLFLLTTEQEVEDFKANIQKQRSFGLKVDFLKPEEITNIAPEVRYDDLLGATFCPTDGFADPHQITLGFGLRAIKMGAEFKYNTEVIGIEMENYRVKGVRTNKGDFFADIVVIAAGPYCGIVGKMAGVDIPIKPVRRQVFNTDYFPKLSSHLPMVVDFHTGLYMRKETGAVLMGKADPNEPPSFNLAVDWEWMVHVSELAIRRVPILEEANIVRGWAGLYQVSPDHHAILGEIPEIQGLYVATGFSGHGLMHSPAVGESMAELIVEGKCELIEPLSIRRFQEGKLIVEKNVI